MSSDSLVDALFWAATDAEENIVEKWNQELSNKTKEEEDEEDEADGICDLVLQIENDTEFNQEYSHLAGLASLPRPGRVSKRTSAPPELGEAMLAGQAEVTVRLAMRFDRVGLFETDQFEPNWEDSAPLAMFSGWKQLVPYDLPASRDIVQEIAEKHQARWDNVKLNASGGAAGFSAGLGVEGLFGIIHKWFTTEDWISLHRARARTIHGWAHRDVSNQEDMQILQNQEAHLFDTSKYSKTCELMTVLTYGNEHVGTITLLKATLEPRTDLAMIIEPLATMTDVPKEILKAMKHRTGVESKVDLVKRGKHLRCVWKGGDEYPAPACVTSIIQIMGKGTATMQWKIGDGWRKALGIRHDKEDDGIVATIPQMIALLHVNNGCFLHNVKSGAAEKFSDQLKAVPHPKDEAKLTVNWSIKRGVKFLKAPEGRGFLGPKQHVVVLFPVDSTWAKEYILWA